MNRMPCSITDGPQWDDDEMFPPPNPDDEHVYKSEQSDHKTFISEQSDDEHDKQIKMYDKQFALNIGLGLLLKDH